MHCYRTSVLARRLDDVAVIGRGLVLKVMAGIGLRAVAEQLAVPHTTVRSWWRCFQSGSPPLVAQCSALAVVLDGTAVMLATSGERAALDALQVAWQRAHVRFGQSVGDLWRFWRRISGGQAVGTKTTSPWEGARGTDWMAESHFGGASP